MGRILICQLQNKKKPEEEEQETETSNDELNSNLNVNNDVDKKTKKNYDYLFAGDVDINETNFPDDEFREYIRTEIDRDGNGKLDKKELSKSELLIGHREGDSLVGTSEIKNLKGIEFFMP